VRGLTMLMVLVSHFGVAYFEPAGAWQLGHVARTIAWPSSQIFILLSGVTIGLLKEEQPGGFDRSAVRIIDRGIFLLLPGHVLILIAHYWVGLSIGPDTRWVFITDAIGTCLVLGPLAVTRLSQAGRVVLGLALIGLSWLAYVEWRPAGPLQDLSKAVLFGELAQGAVFPVIPWFGTFLVATTIGARLSGWRRDGQPAWAFLLVLGGSAVSVGLLAHLAAHHQPGLVGQLVNLRQKYPPGPLFLSTGAGVGLALLAAAERVAACCVLPVLMRGLAFVGRSSLVTFIIQYYVYYVGLFLLHLPMSRLWPCYLLISAMIVLGLAWLWQNMLGKDYLTVGLPVLVAIIHRHKWPGIRRLSTRSAGR
jgi:hypothetical protein